VSHNVDSEEVVQERLEHMEKYFTHVLGEKLMSGTNVVLLNIYKELLRIRLILEEKKVE
jgi:hypothetical protein